MPIPFLYVCLYAMRRFFRTCRASACSIAATCLTAVAFTSITCPIVESQTAHLSGVHSKVGPSYLPYGIGGFAVDQSGNTYITDENYGVIHKETLSAGVYTESTFGSCLNSCGGLAVDGIGNVYVADSFNNRVLKETPSGSGYIQSVVASNINGLTWVAAGPNGDVFVVDYLNSRILKETPSGSGYIETVAVSGISNSPWVIVADANDNFYMTIGNGASISPSAEVVKETFSGGIYTQSFVDSVVGTPTGIAVDVNGNLYISDSTIAKVYKETPTGGGYVQSFVGFDNLYEFPWGVGVDSLGNVYTAYQNSILKQTQAAGNFGGVNVGSPSAVMTLVFSFDAQTTIGTPAVLTQGAAGLDFTDAGTGTCTSNGTSHIYYIGTSCTVNVLFTPRYPGTRYGAAVLSDNSGNVIATGYVQGIGSGAQINFFPGVQSTIPAVGLGPGGIPANQNAPFGVAVDAAGNLYIADVKTVLKETLTGGSYTQSTIGSGLNSPVGLAVDGSGNLYIADDYGNQVVKETLSGGSYTQSVVAPNGSNLLSPNAVAVDGIGNVYIADSENNRVLKETLSSNGTYSESIIASGLADPLGVAVDGTGNVYISDSVNLRVLKETLTNGTYTQTTIVSGLNDPEGLAVDGIGNIYITDFTNNRVLKEMPIAGGYAQSSISTRFPVSVAVAGNGNLYISGDYYDTVVEQDYADAPNLSFASTKTGQISSDSPQIVAVENTGNAALTFPVLSTGNNPSIATNFTLNSGGTDACSLVTAGSSTAGSLAMGESCQLSVSFEPTNAGSINGSLVLTDNNLNAGSHAYASQKITLSGSTSGVTPTITWLSPSQIIYGANLSSVLNAAAETGSTAVPGTLAYTATLAGGNTVGVTTATVLGAGTYTLNAAFAPADTTDYTSASKSISLTVNKATPSIAWTAPAAITYGTALSAVQLDANASIPGNFSYSSPAGTILSAGSHTLGVTFVPTDVTDYTSVTANVSLTVNRATPKITWTTPADITYGTVLSAIQLDASSTVPGAFAYSSPLGTVLNTGSHTITATFAPTDATDYTTTTAIVTLVINQAAPKVTWTNPAAIVYGTALSATQLDASASIPGTFTYSSPIGTVLGVGSYSLIASFTPTDSTNYTGATATVALLVNQATPKIAWSAPTVITYGTALGSTQLNATSSVPGAFTYSVPAGTVLNAGSHSLTVTFSPADSKDYAGVTAVVTLLVNQATPRISWPTPAAVAYGSTLSATQLDASTSVAGSFTYSPSAGTMLSVGAHPLSVSFAPTDSADYTTSSSMVSLTVSKATPAVSLVSSANAVFVSNAVVFTANVSSPVGSPTGSVTFFDGTTLLGPAAVTAGTAALSIPSLNVGPHSITATYSGDSNFNTLTTPSLTETIQDFSIAVSGSRSATAPPGGSAAYALVVNPLDGNTFPGSIAFALSGLPSRSNCCLYPCFHLGKFRGRKCYLNRQLVKRSRLAISSQATQRRHNFGHTRLYRVAICWQIPTNIETFLVCGPGNDQRCYFDRGIVRLRRRRRVAHLLHLHPKATP